MVIRLAIVKHIPRLPVQAGYKANNRPVYKACTMSSKIVLIENRANLGPYRYKAYKVGQSYQACTKYRK